MINSKRLQRKEINRMRGLYKSGARPQEIANKMGCSHSTAKVYQSILRTNHQNSTDYFNALAREKDFRDHHDRYKINTALFKMDKSDETAQGRFENSLVNGGLMYSCGVASNIGLTDLIIDLGEALDELSIRHYSPRGAITYDKENPSGAREVGIIKDYYYLGINTQEISTKLGISQQRVNILLDRGINHLRAILERE